MFKYIIFLSLILASSFSFANKTTEPRVFKANVTPSKIIERVVVEPYPVAVPVNGAADIDWKKADEISRGKVGTECQEKKGEVEYKVSDMIKCNNEVATVVPRKTQFYNTIQKFPFSEGMQYKIITALGQTTDIQFQPGEVIYEGGIYLGNKVLYQMGGAVSGSKDRPIYHLNIKPIYANQKTNLKVYTSKRVYFFELISMDEGEGYLSGVSFTYPNQSMDFFYNINQKHEVSKRKRILSEKVETPSFTFDMATANFNYKVKLTEGKKPSWYPIRVIDNGKETYIEFDENSDVPAIYIEYEKGKGLVPQFRPYANGIVVAQLADVIVLRDGAEEDDNVREVKIYRK